MIDGIRLSGMQCSQLFQIVERSIVQASTDYAATVRVARVAAAVDGEKA